MTTEARRVLDESISEREFQQQIVDFANLNGWIYFHPYDSRRSTAGYPDLTLARISITPQMEWRTDLVFFEVKRQSGRMTDAQATWLAILRHVPGVIARMVKPSDWPEIERILTTPPLGRGGR